MLHTPLLVVIGVIANRATNLAEKSKSIQPTILEVCDANFATTSVLNTSEVHKTSVLFELKVSTSKLVESLLDFSKGHVAWIAVTQSMHELVALGTQQFNGIEVIQFFAEELVGRVMQLFAITFDLKSHTAFTLPIRSTPDSTSHLLPFF